MPFSNSQEQQPYNDNTLEAHSQQLTIGLLPYQLDANGYIAENRRILSNIGTVKPVPKPTKLLIEWLIHLFTTKKRFLYDVIIINWRENCLIKSRKIRLSGIFEYVLTIALHRVCSRTLVYVRHNKYPHNLKLNDISKARQWLKFGESLSDSIVVHSPLEKSEPHHIYVPHPLYTQSIATKSHTAVSDSNAGEQDYILMFGRIEPYKQIHLVIENWRGKHDLRIAGPCSDKKYLEKLENIAQGKPVYIEPEFQPDAKLSRLVRMASGVIIANHEDSMITSGSFFFSLSCGTPVFALSNPFYSWVNDSACRTLVYTSPDIKDLILMIEDVPFDGLNRDELTYSARSLFSEKEIENCWRKVISSEKNR